MRRGTIAVFTAGFTSLALTACAMGPAPTRSNLQPNHYVTAECNRLVSELRPLYDERAKSGEGSLRIQPLETRAAIMGCNPGRSLAAQ